MRAIRFLLLALGLLAAAPCSAADFSMPGGPQPAGLDEVFARLNADAHDLELLVSFGTSKGGSAGHLALAIRDGADDDGQVYSANFYADRAPEHASGFYNAELMVRVPKREYLYGTSSVLGETASFGLDYGEVYKRSVVGIRVYGVPPGDKRALAAFFARLNDDFGRRAPSTEYHGEEIKYGYMHLNCAKTIGSAFKFGAGYRDLEVKGLALLPNRPVAKALNANIPTEMAMKLLREWDARGYRMDAVLYRKYPGSPYVDPHEEEKVAFRDLPNRFPSVISLDFRNDEGHYEDYDNLLAMYLLYNLGRYGVAIDPQSRRLEVQATRTPLPYPDALRVARESAEADSKHFLRRLLFGRQGKRVDDPVAPSGGGRE